MDYNSYRTSLDVEKVATMRTSYVGLIAMLVVMGEVPLGDGADYSAAVRSAFCKSVEYGSLCSAQWDQHPSPFFVTASLRGICEDLIVLTWLSSCDEADRSEYISAITLLQLRESLRCQADFLQHAGTGQAILAPESFIGDWTVESTFVRLRRRYAWPRRTMTPSVFWCAKQVGLTPLYKYLYFATSNSVHFSPFHLFRSLRGHDLSDGSGFLFSTNYAREYYADFNLIYGAHLCLLFYDHFRHLLDPDNFGANAIAAIERVTDSLTRWPEILTFEDMDMTPVRANSDPRTDGTGNGPK
jgi:hypothetical protein